MFDCISQGEVLQTITYQTYSSGFNPGTGEKSGESWGAPLVEKQALVWESGKSLPFQSDSFKDQYDLVAFTPDLTSVDVNMRVVVNSKTYSVAHIENVAMQNEVFLTYMRIV